jgi:hypothetical protein
MLPLPTPEAMASARGWKTFHEATMLARRLMNTVPMTEPTMYTAKVPLVSGASGP